MGPLGTLFFYFNNTHALDQYNCCLNTLCLKKKHNETIGASLLFRCVSFCFKLRALIYAPPWLFTRRSPFFIAAGTSSISPRQRNNVKHSGPYTAIAVACFDGLLPVNTRLRGDLFFSWRLLKKDLRKNRLSAQSIFQGASTGEKKRCHTPGRNLSLFSKRVQGYGDVWAGQDDRGSWRDNFLSL